MAASHGSNELLGEVMLRLPSRTVRVSVELGDALSTPADALVLKYAQGSYGVDFEARRRLEEADIKPGLPPAGAQVAVPAGSAASVRTIVFIGTPPIARLDYEDITAWATRAVSPADGRGRSGNTAFLEATSMVTTVHGVENLDYQLDEIPSLQAQLTGFLNGLRRRTDSKLERIHIVELNEERAERLADALPKIARQQADIELVNVPRYSVSVRLVRSELASTDGATAGAVARALQAQHKEYAAGRFGEITIDADAGRRLPVARWLERVQDLYSHHGSTEPLVIDGRMLLAGLTKLDRDLRQTLDEAGVTDALWAELKVQPGELPLREDVLWTPDAPATEDHLGRRLVATALGERLTECDAAHPGHSFLVHIDGPWGVGKSTLLKFLVDDIRRRDPSWCVVEFDAWRQARAGPPWLLLLTAVRSALRRDSHLSRRSALHERWRLVGGRYQLASVALLAVLGVLAGLWASGVTDFDTATSATAGTVTLVATAWAVSKALGRFVVLDSRRGATAFVDTRRDPMEELAGHFQWLRSQSPAPLLLAIDDLDRCGHDYVVEFLDSTQKLLRDRPANLAKAWTPRSLFVVVAADGRWLSQAYELAHSSFADAVGEPGRPLGSLFLDKLFALRVPVPHLSPNRQESFLRRLLGSGGDVGSPAPDGTELEAQIQEAASSEQVIDALAAAPTEQRIQAASTAREQLAEYQESEHALVQFAPLLEPNPRSVLRFTTAFDVLRAARLAEGNPVPADRLALWAIIVTRWPALADFLQHNPDAVGLFLDQNGDVADRVPPDLRPLFANPGAEIRHVFNHRNGGPVTAAVIRECAGVA